MKFVARIVEVTAYLYFITILIQCSDKLPEIGKFEKEYNLINQYGEQVEFPGLIKNRIAVVGYIFTNCPDICPLTTNNMRLIQEKLKKDKINNVEFVSISFDPLTDTPDVLRKFADIRDLDLGNWVFLTGQKTIIDSLIIKAGVFAVPSDSTKLKNGKKIYYFVHTDRIQLVDKKGVIRKNYPGSKINVDEIVEDIKMLAE